MEHEMFLLILVNLLLSGLLILMGMIFFRSIVNPLTAWVLGFIFPSFTTLLSPKLVDYINAYLWLYIFIASSIFFMMGSLGVVSFYFSIEKMPNPRKNKDIVKIFLWDKKFLGKSIYIIFFLSLVGFFLNLYNAYSILGTINPFSVNIRTWELAFGGISPIINYLYFLCCISFFLSGIYMNTYGKDFKILIVRYLSLFMTFFHGIKSTIIVTILIDATLSALLIYLTNQKIFYKSIAKKLIIITFITISAFAYVSLGRFGKIDDYGIIFETFFSYINYNYINLQLQIEKGEIFLYGSSTFGPFYSLIHFLITLKKIGDEANQELLILLNEAYNVGTVLRTFVIDFGILGICIGSFLIGFITTISYVFFISKRSILTMFIYGVLFSQTLLSFFVEFIRLQFIYWILVFYFLNQIHNKKIPRRLVNE